MMPYGLDPQVEMEIKQSKYYSQFIYLVGNPLEQRDLKRCLVEKASAVLILSNKLTFDAQQEDTRTIL